MESIFDEDFTSLSRKRWCHFTVASTLTIQPEVEQSVHYRCVLTSSPPSYRCLSCPQVTRLQENVQRGEQDIGAAEGQICTLKEAQDKLLEELDATRARLRETSNLLTALQVCMSQHAGSGCERMLRHCIRFQTHLSHNIVINKT